MPADMDIFSRFRGHITGIIEQLGISASDGSALNLSRVAVEPPREAAHGDLATNAAMVLAKQAGMKPRDLAEQIAERLGDIDGVEAAEVAGPGFINIRLVSSFWQGYLGEVLAAGEEFGHSNAANGTPMNVEYVSANPTGPMHVGHCRGAVVGDALANLLAATGYAVTREYYINDAGAQVDVLARSAYLRYREALGEDIGAIPDGLYPGDYLVPVGKELADVHGKALLEMEEAGWLETVRDLTIERMMDAIRQDLSALNVRHDVFFSERSLSGGSPDRVAQAVDHLRNLGLIYQGTLPPPKGQVPEDWEDREQTLFRSSDYGDDVDRAILKSDGSYTYFASDIAYHYDKYLRGFHFMIDVLGADHGGYVKRMKAVVKAMTEGKGDLDIKLCQLVNLYRAGEPVRMSKRAGDFVTLAEVVEEVGADAVRFMMLYRKNDAPLDFDFQKVTEQSRDNPVFYVQYAHARCKSVFRQAANELPGLEITEENLLSADLSRLDDEGELSIIRRLAEYPRMLQGASEAHEPHRVAFFLYELASDFHGHWNRGKESPSLRFIHPDDTQLSMARLALVRAVALVIASGLAILGVNAPDEMR